MERKDPVRGDSIPLDPSGVGDCKIKGAHVVESKNRNYLALQYTHIRWKGSFYVQTQCHVGHMFWASNGLVLGLSKVHKCLRLVYCQISDNTKPRVQDESTKKLVLGQKRKIQKLWNFKILSNNTSLSWVSKYRISWIKYQFAKIVEGDRI